MPEIQMSEGQVLNLKIVSITPNVKLINKASGPVWRHDIFLEDRTGKTMRGEYLTKDQNMGDAFIPGIWQNVKCIFPDPKGATIEPYAGEIAGSTQRQSLPVATSESSQVSPGINCHNINMAGRNITFATAYAKDLLVAEMKNWPEKRRVTTKDIKRMMGWADAICHETCDRINF